MTGTFLIAVAILFLLVAGAYGVQKLMAARVLANDGSVEKAQRDADDPIPALLLLPDDSTPVGDNPDAHDEITPHDLPLTHPGRHEAERQAGDDAKTTRGDEDPADAGG